MTQENKNLGETGVARRARSVQGRKKRYRVSAEKVLPDPGFTNPFWAFRTAEAFEGATSKVLVRTWEFEAPNEGAVRRLFEEAKRDGEPQVQGMSIRSIEELK